MTRKSGKQTSARDEKSETWFPEGGAKSAGDSGLNKAINAAEGGRTDPDSPLETPEIQPKGNFPSPEEAYADMSQPAPAPPPERFSLDRSSSPPRAAFRVKKREGTGHYIWMFNMPFGTAGRGEAFTYPVAAASSSSWRNAHSWFRSGSRSGCASKQGPILNILYSRFPPIQREPSKRRTLACRCCG